MASLILVNSFTDTAVFHHSEESAAFWVMPALVLRSLVMKGLEVRGEGLLKGWVNDGRRVVTGG